MIKSTLILLLLISISSCAPEQKESFTLVIKNGTLLDVATGALEEKDIFISEGRIVKLAPRASQQLFEAEKTIDATGKFILPGFWDNHTHFRGGDSLIAANKNFLNLFIANGITTVRDAGGDLTPSVLAWKKEIASGELVGPTIFTSGPKIDGPNGTWAGSLAVETEASIITALDSLQAIPSDFVKLYDSKISGEAYLKTIAEAENRDMITSGHMPFTVELGDAVGAGIDAIEHLYYVMKGCSSSESDITQLLLQKKIGFWDAMPQLMSTYADTTAQHTFKNLKDNKVFVVPTLHIGETLSFLDEFDHTKDTYLKYMSAGIQQTYEGRIKRALQSSDAQIKSRKELQRFFGKLAKDLNTAGVGLLAGSDSGAYNSYTYPGISLHKELEEMVNHGIPPLDALRASAYNGAVFLKKSEDYGTITAGKISDLVLLEANPLEDITNTKRIFSVVQGQHVYNKQRLKNILKSALVNP